MSQVIERYEHVECRKKEGAHYTPQKLSTFVSQKILEKVESKKSLILADPAIGDGELILSMLETIKDDTHVKVYGFDTNLESIELSRKRIEQHFPNVEICLIHGDFLEYCLLKGTMLQEQHLPDFDIIIANPPYIRTQVLGAEQSQILAKNFNLKGRVDIYQAFLVGMSKCMTSDGVAGVIVSNRFLTTKGSGELRQSLFQLYDIHNIWDFGDTKLFEAAVLPAVLLFSLKSPKRNVTTQFSSIYETKEEATNVADCPVDAISLDGVVQCSTGKSFFVNKGILEFDSEPKDTWRIQDDRSSDWLRHVKENTWASFGDIGKIRVGVKTTADNVFIRSSWHEETGVEPELLKPLITHHVAGRFAQGSSEPKKILYTHEMQNGKKKAIDLEKFPISKAYLEKHKEQLEGRKYVIKAKRNWFEIWVPQNPALWSEKKVVFRDICEEPTFWLDENESVVNGDCYWMVNEYCKEYDDILWLVLAVANSKFIEKFYDTKFNNKLYSNKRRFITQYVEKFPLPDPSLKISKDMIRLAKTVFNTKNNEASLEIQNDINKLVWEAFKLPAS